MTDTTVTASITLSPSEQWLVRLGIRPEDKSVTMLLFSNMFLSGIAIGMIRVCAFTLFLKYYGSEQLALIAILLAMIGMPLTILIDRLTSGFTTRAHIFTILSVIIGGLLLFRSLLGLTDSPILVFTLPLFFELVYMLFSLQFIFLLTRLLNVRQAKRLSGIARSGEFLAEMVGGLLIIILLNFLDVKDLLVIAMITTGLVFAVVNHTTTRFKSTLLVTNEEIVEGEITDSRLFGMLKLPYVKLITWCYGAYMFAYFFLEIAFYSYASIQFPDERELAKFIAQFFAVTGFLTMLTMVLLFAPFLRKFGIIAGVIAFPLIIFVGSSAVSIMEFSGVGVAAIFAVMVATNCARFILQAAIWKPSVAILFQVLPDRQRTAGAALMEGVIDPVAGGLAGICLFLLINMLGWEPKHFLVLLSILMIFWLLISIFIRRQYLSNLVVSIQKRKLGELTISELDNASLDIIKAGLTSLYPAEIFYCLNLLEKIEHPEITELLKQVLPNSNKEVRMDVLKRIATMKIKPLTAHVLQRIESETDPVVRSQALITYAALAPDNTVERLSTYLENLDPDLTHGALVGILTLDPSNDNANDFLLKVVRSGSPQDRLFASKVMADIGDKHFSGFLVELLEDPDNEVVERAIYAAGLMGDSRLINLLVAKLSNPTLLPAASAALKQFGETALYDLDLGFTSPEAGRQEKLHIIDIVREIGGVKATEILLRHIDIDQPELRHRIFLSLASLHYQADPDDQYIFVNKLDEEVHNITWLLAAMEDLFGEERYQLVHSALGHELDVKRDSMLLLISFLFPSIVMLDTRANIDSKVAELRIFALEVLDNLLTGEIKQIVLPILDDLTVSERLAFLSEKFPQEIMSPEERFNNIVESHFDKALFWTRNTLLYQIGQDRESRLIDKVRGSLQDREATIRETGLWALAQLKPPDLQRTLQAHAGDDQENVSDMVRQLLAGLPAPEPT
ncbi:MAG: HEAT repeat domain-containing protein [Proteobacteria bacterium]|nr:HEAT repeat domain-containing protein [Pseudomonadota bacterium]